MGLWHSAGLGKMQPLDSVVWTSDGPVTMGDIQAGMRIERPEGGECLVLGVFPQDTQPVWRVVLEDGRSARCGRDHLWTVQVVHSGQPGRWRETATTDALIWYLTCEGLEVLIPNLGVPGGRIVAIEHDGEAPCRCIAVSNPSGLYITDDRIVTHNTASALAAWSMAPAAHTLIVTKAIGRHVWGRDAAWVLGDGFETSVLWGGQRYSKSGTHRDGTFTDMSAALDHSGMLVTNYEVLVKRLPELLQVPWAYFILDEAHAIKQGWQRPRRRASGSTVKRRFEGAVELARGVRARRGRVWELTATPVPDRVRDLWAQLHLVLPDETMRFHPGWVDGEPVAESLWPQRCWAGRFCQLERGFNESLDSRGSSNLDALKTYLETRFLTATRASVAHELPAIQRDVREVSPRLDRENMGGGVEQALARAAAAKFEPACELAVEYLATKEKVVLVTNRRKANGQLVKALAQHAKKSLPSHVYKNLWLSAVSGETEIRQRVGVTRDFQEYTGPAALVATIDSITEAIDLHQASGIVFCALPYTPRQLQQCEGRVGRMGGVPSTIHYLVATDTIDEEIRRLILSKLEATVESGADTQGADGALGAISGMRSEDEILDELRGWLG